jgi:hypothetical protein
MKNRLMRMLLVVVVTVVAANAEKHENEYDDLNVAKLGQEETAMLAELTGKWKRPLYSKADPKYAEDWAEITSYKIPAEGPITSWKLVESREGIMWDYKKSNKTGEFRFTQSKDGKTLYAIMMTWPTSGHALIKSLKSGSEYRPGEIASVELMGSTSKLDWKRTAEGLRIVLPADGPCDHAYAFRIR